MKKTTLERKVEKKRVKKEEEKIYKSTYLHAVYMGELIKQLFFLFLKGKKCYINLKREENPIKLF